MAPPNIPADFDFLDPDVNLGGCPSRNSPSCASPSRSTGSTCPAATGGFGDTGYWLVTKHADVKEVSRRSDVFSSWQNGAIPTWPQGDDARGDRAAAQRHAQHGRAAPHPAAQDHLARVHPARHRTAGGASSPSAPRTSPRPLPPRAAATSSSRCRASCRCRPSPVCWVFPRRTATSCSAGPTR